MKRQHAFELRCQKKTFRQIADALGVSVCTAFQYVDEHWQKVEALTIEKADCLRQMELKTLDEMEARWMPLAVHPEAEASGDSLKAVDRVLKIQERRAKLLGIDAPEKHELSGKLIHEHLTLDELEKRLQDARA